MKYNYQRLNILHKFSICAFVLLLVLLSTHYNVNAAESATSSLSLSDIWNRDKVLIHLEGIKKAINDLKSENTDIAVEGHQALMMETGLDYINPIYRKNRIVDWTEYGKRLQEALSQKIPLILSKQTRENSWDRALAVMFLGDSAPHPAFVPLLKRIIDSPSEDWNVRYKALIAISRIPHEGMIEYLIEQIDTDLKDLAIDQLTAVTHHRPYNIEGSRMDSEQYKQRYREWWTNNKQTFKYNRSWSLWS